jgi:hypothetical protein
MIRIACRICHCTPLRCAGDQTVNDFTVGRQPEGGFAPKRPECLKCGSAAKVGPEEAKDGRRLVLAIVPTGGTVKTKKPGTSEGAQDVPSCRTKDMRNGTSSRPQGPKPASVLGVCSGPNRLRTLEHDVHRCNEKGKRSLPGTLNVSQDVQAERKAHWATVGPDDKAVSMFLEDCTYCGRPATFKKLESGSHRQQPPLRPAERGVMLHVQLHQAAGHAHILASLSTHPPSTPGLIAREERDYRQGGASCDSGPLVRSRRLSAGQAPRNTQDKAQFKADHQLCLYCGLSSGGIDRYDMHRLRVRHRQHGSMLHRVQLHEG